MEIKALASGSTGNCYILNDGSSTILLDAGIPIQTIRIGCEFKLFEVSGALISHRHNDHSKSVCDLLKAGIDVYATEDVFEAKKAAGHCCKTITSGIDNGRLKRWLQLGTFKVMPFDCHHDVPNLGFYIHSTATNENLLYFTDTYYITYLFPDLHYIMAEANYSSEAINKSIADGRIPVELKKRLVQSHMSIDNLVAMLKHNDLSKIKRIYLLHLSDNNSNESEFKRKVQEVAGCEVFIC
ncbi:MAG: MBL fold metallo-hydrolase [Bacilli bacterium]